MAHVDDNMPGGCGDWVVIGIFFCLIAAVIYYAAANDDTVKAPARKTIDAYEADCKEEGGRVVGFGKHSNIRRACVINGRFEKVELHQ